MTATESTQTRTSTQRARSGVKASNARKSGSQAKSDSQPKANGAARANGIDKDGNRTFGQGALIGAAAAGLVIGLAATIGRRAATQAVVALRGDWFEALKAEHQMVLKLFDRIEATTNHQTTKRNMLLMQLKHALAKHAFEEENVIYPALREHGENDEADHLNHDHGYVKQFLFDLEHCPTNSTQWLEKARAFRAEIEKHMREEEETIFPSLHARLDKSHNHELTAAVAKEGFKLA